MGQGDTKESKRRQVMKAAEIFMATVMLFAIFSFNLPILISSLLCVFVVAASIKYLRTPPSRKGFLGLKRTYWGFLLAAPALLLSAAVPDGSPLKNNILASADAIHTAKEAVRRSLKDPDSAIFQNVRYVKKFALVCGEVNAKNSLGGYTGFQDFYTQPYSSLPSVENESTDYSYAKWTEYCLESKY